MNIRSLIPLVVVVLSLTVSAQVVVHVDSAAAPGGNGSLASPFQNLESAAALLTSAQDVVRIKRGSVFVAPATFVVPSNTHVTTYGAGPKPVIDMAGTESSIGVRADDVSGVLIEDIVVCRANRGFTIFGSAGDVRLLRCEAIEIFQNDGFAHSAELPGQTASGTVIFEQCRAFRCDGDGFYNSGTAQDVALGCEAIGCGPKWDSWDVPPAAPRVDVLWVDSVAGQDSFDGSTPSRALKTLAAASLVAGPGTEVRLVRGSKFTTPFRASDGQLIVAHGVGRRPTIAVGDQLAAIEVDDAAGVRIEGLHITASRTGIVSTGGVAGLEIVDCQIAENGVGVALSGQGLVGLYGSRIERNEHVGVLATGDAAYLSIDSTIVGHDRHAWSRGLEVLENASVILVGDAYEENTVGVRLSGSGFRPLIYSCYFADNQRDGFGAALHVDRESDTVDPIVVNSIIVTPDPVEGGSIHGVLATSGVVAMNDTFYNANSGETGAVSRSLTLENGAASTVVVNCVFDDAGVSEARFIEAEGGLLAAVGNWFHFPENVESKWTVRGTAMGWNGWTGQDGVEDAFVGGITSASMVRLDPTRTRWYAALAGPAGRGPAEGGVDLSVVFQVLGLPREDAGRRPRAIDGTWSSGALEQRTFSSDGFTTHDSSAFRIVSCLIESCSDGIHFTHLNPSGSETAVIDCEIRDILEVGLHGTLDQNFTVSDCRFIDCERGIGGLRPSVGSTQVIDSCLFAGCREAALYTDPIFPARIRLENCVVILPETFDHPEGHGINVAAGPINLDVFNTSFVVPVLESEDSPTFAVNNRDGGLVLYNNVFTGARGRDDLYVRVPSASQVTVADHNFYETRTTTDARWACGGLHDFAGWQGLMRGTMGTPTDHLGGASSAPLVAASGDARALAEEEYFVDLSSVAYGQGLSASALFNRAWADTPRASTGPWNIGPSSLADVAATIQRDLAGKTRFQRFLVDTGAGLDLLLADRSVEATGEHVVITEISFAATAGVTAIVHEGAYPGTRTLWSGSLSTVQRTTATFIGNPYEDVYVTFLGGPGFVTGEITYTIN